MALTYQLISSNILSATATSVTFSSIPNTFTDLLLKASTRNDAVGVNYRLDVRFNGNSNSVYSRNYLQTDGSAVGGVRTANLTLWENPEFTNGATSPASTFSNAEYYIPSYLATNNRQLSSQGFLPNNTNPSYRISGCSLFRDTTAISSITLSVNSGNWVVGSSFYLYGIKNS